MAQTFKYTVVGDTQPAVKGNEALDASINKVDASTQKLSEDTKKLQAEQAKQAEAANKAFSTQLENKIKTTDSLIKGLGGTVNLLTGTLATVVGTLGLFGVDDEQIAGFQKAAISVLALSTGITQQLTGLKDVTEAQKLQNEVTQASVTVNRLASESENTNTVALAANKDAVTGVTAAFGSAAISIAGETTVTAGNTNAKALNSGAEAVNTTTKTANTVATRLNTIAQIALNTAIKANPYLAIGSILISVATLIYGVTSALFANTEAEEDNTEAKELNERAIKAQEEATKSLDRVRGESDIKAAERAIREAKAEKVSAEARFLRAKAENQFSEATKLARIEIIEANTAITNAELDLKDARDEAAKKSIEDGKKVVEQAKQNAAEQIKIAEDLANQAAKQLKDEQEALENLIALTEELALLDGSAFISRSSGQLEFNTELDRTNFLLKEQLDVLSSLNTEYEDLGDQLEVITDDFGESFFNEEQLAVFKKLRDAQKTGLQLQLEDLRTTYLEDLTLFSDNENVKTQLTEQYEKDRAKLRREYAIQNAQAIIGITSNFLNVIADINQQSLQLQLLQAAGNQSAIDKINADALEKQKKLRTAQVLITTAESILNGFNATSNLPPPFNFIAGGILGLAYGALGAKTIQTINSTTLEGGGSTGGFNNIPSGGFGSISLPGGAGIPTGISQGAILPGLGGGRITTAPTTVGETREPLRAYVLAGDVENGVQANIALNNRRRLAG
jgi:hypothetical protein